MLLTRKTMEWILAYYEPIVNYYKRNAQYRRFMYKNRDWVIDRFLCNQFKGKVMSSAKNIIYTRENISDMDSNLIAPTDINIP